MTFDPTRDGLVIQTVRAGELATALPRLARDASVRLLEVRAARRLAREPVPGARPMSATPTPTPVTTGRPPTARSSAILALHAAVVLPAPAVGGGAGAVRRRAPVRAARPRRRRARPSGRSRTSPPTASSALVVPIAALVIGDSVLGAEVRAGTFHFTWLSPTPTGRSCSVAGSAARSSRSSRSRRRARSPRSSPARPTSVGPASLAAAVGARAYVAVFIAIGCLTRRTAVWSLAFVFLVERLLGAALTGIAQLSPTWESRAIFVGCSTTRPAGSCARASPPAGAAVVRLLIVSARRPGHRHLAHASPPPAGCGGLVRTG